MTIQLINRTTPAKSMQETDRKQESQTKLDQWLENHLRSEVQNGQYLHKTNESHPRDLRESALTWQLQ